jgi:DNA-binding GntR family transcriptional regulator
LRKRDIGVETLSDNVYEILKGKILKLDIKPGTILTEKDVSAEYDISRSPVRSVFQKLKADGLVTAIPYKLSYVSQLDMKKILDVIYMRIAVESAIMRDFILLDDKKSIRTMMRNLEDQMDLLESEDISKEFEMIDIEFHKIMYQALNKMELWETIQRTELSYNRFKVLDLVAVGKYQQIIKDHEAFMAIIQAKRIDDIEMAYRRHLYSGIRRMRGFIFSDYPDYFSSQTSEDWLEEIDAILLDVYGDKS